MGVSLLGAAGSAAAECTGLGGTSVSCLGVTTGHVTASSTGATTGTANNWKHDSGNLYLSATGGNIGFTANNVTLTNGSSPAQHGLIHIASDGAYNASLTVAGSNFTTADGGNAQGLVSHAVGSGNALAKVSGSNVTMNAGSVGPAVQALVSGGGNGSAVVEFRTGQIVTIGATGLSAAGAAGGAKITERGSTIQTSGQAAHAVDARIQGGGAGDVVIDTAGEITTNGAASHGINATSDTGTVSIETSSPIVTHGAGSTAINAASNSGAIAIVQKGALVTHGAGSIGVDAHSNGGNIEIESSGNVSVLSAEAGTHAIRARNDDLGGLGGGVFLSVSGEIETKGEQSIGILGELDGAGGTGDVAVEYLGLGVTTAGAGSHAVMGYNQGAGNITIDANGAGQIHTLGDSAHAIYGEHVGTGNVAVASSGPIETAGTKSHGIMTHTTSGESGVANSSAILAGGVGSHGINATADTGAVNVVNHGEIITNGVGGMGIRGASQGNVTISSTSNIVTNATEQVGASPNEEAHAILGLSSGDGSVTVDASGTIETHAGGASGIRGYAAGSGGVNVIHSGASLKTYGDQSVGIHAQGVGAGTVAVDNRGTIDTVGLESDGISAVATSGAIHVANAGLVTTSGTGANGIEVTATTGNIILTNEAAVTTTGMNASALVGITAGAQNIENRAAVTGGWGSAAAGIVVQGMDAGVTTVTNTGVVGALSDRAVRDASGPGASLSIDNQVGGVIAGYMTLGDGANTVANAGTWDLRHLADSDGDGVRDTLATAVADFGAGTANTVTNSGTLNLLGGTAANVDTVGVFNSGYTVNTLASGGAVQGMILGLARFTNSGVIDMSINPVVGDVLVISGARMAGTSGNGTFVSDGGLVKIDTVLNEGGANTQSDLLVVDGVELAGAATAIQVNNVGGAGAYTVDDGIEVVRVLDAARSAASAFVLNGRVVAGVYEYTLQQGGTTEPANGNWYLRNSLPPVEPPVTPEPEVPVEPPVTPEPEAPVEPPVTPEPEAPVEPPATPDPVAPAPCGAACEPQQPEPEVVPLYRPEPFVYLANQIAANGMFQHTLHDRLGEPNYAERTRPEDDKATAGWVRVQGRQLNTRTAEQIGADIDSWIVQAGVEIGRWGMGDGRFHAGAMLGTGRSTTRVDSEVTRHKAIGRVQGNSLGVYGTWYANAEHPTGPYVDAWLQYGRYDNDVSGDYQVTEDYKSSTLAFSLEAGYAWQVRDNGRSVLYVEPQVQAIVTDYSSDRFTETSGLEVRDAGGAELLTRLGARLYGHTTTQQHNWVQPFVEVNWWHAVQEASMRFDNLELDQVLPRDRYELKLGAELELGRGWTGWGSFGVQQGKQDYQSLNGVVGLKRVW